MVEDESNGRPLLIMQWDMVIKSDASKKGWGMYCGEVSTGGPWTLRESQHDINYLELLAAFLAFQTFTLKLRGMTKLQCYSTGHACKLTETRMSCYNTLCIPYISLHPSLHALYMTAGIS